MTEKLVAGDMPLWLVKLFEDERRLKFEEKETPNGVYNLDEGVLLAQEDYIAEFYSWVMCRTSGKISLCTALQGSIASWRLLAQEDKCGLVLSLVSARAIIRSANIYWLIYFLYNALDSLPRLIWSHCPADPKEYCGICMQKDPVLQRKQSKLLVDWICCDKCDQWFHEICLAENKVKIKKKHEHDWVCPDCKQSKKLLKRAKLKKSCMQACWAH